MKKYLIIFSTIILAVIIGYLSTAKINNKKQVDAPTIAKAEAASDIENAILTLDTGGHTGLIRDLIVTPYGEVITASDDKTIRVWDAGTLKEKRKILGEIWDNRGEIYAIALSPDEKYLAVGGLLDKPEIRIYDYQSSRLIELLAGHSKVVSDLSFSEDGKYLVSGSSDHTVKVWDTSNWSCIKTLEEHDNDVYGVAMKREGNDYGIYSVGLDRKVYKHFLKSKNILHYDDYGNNLDSLAINDKHLAVCGDGKYIDILDRYTLKKAVPRIDSITVPSGLTFSPDGRYLLAGAAQFPDILSIYDSHKKYSEIAGYYGFNNMTRGIGFINNYQAISAGGSNYDIVKWEFNDSTVEEGIAKASGVGSVVYSVGIKGDIITFGQTWVMDLRLSDFEKSFNLSSMTVGNDIFGISRIDITGLKTEGGGEYGYNDATLVLPSGAKVTRESFTGYRHNCYGRWGDKFISGGAGGSLYVYGKNGKTLASLVGHTGEVLSIAVDSDRLVSGSSDQTIKIWDLKRVLNGEKEINPILTLFVGTNNEWIAWTDEGFFDASPEGAKLIGYHINRGADKEAEFVSVDKMYYAFYRPDLIKKALAGESLKKYADKINIAEILKGGLAPKVAILSAINKNNANTADIRFQVCDNGGGYNNLSLMINGTSVERDNSLSPIKTYQVNGQTCYDFSKSIKLAAGNNVISFNASNKAGSIISDTASVSLDYRATDTSKPTLYILSIAVDEYREKQLNYAKADGDLLIDTLKETAQDIYKSIEVTALRDEEVTNANILTALSKIGKQTQRGDVFILHVVGHGKTDTETGEYYFLPADFRNNDSNSLKTQGFSRDDFINGLSKVQALNKLVLVDTCDSGGMVEDRGGSDTMKMVNDTHKATGVAMITASASEQIAKEGYKKHGVFTYSVVQGLKGGAKGRDGKVSVKSLRDFVNKDVPKRTHDKWKVYQDPKSNIENHNFVISGS